MKRAFRFRHFRPDAEEDIREETDFYLEMRTREFMAEGMPEEEARAAAEAVFGDLDRHRESARRYAGAEIRRRGRRNLIGSLGQDLRFAARSFRKDPVFTVTAIVILAIGIAATTTIFSVVDTILLRPLPYTDSGELVYLDPGGHTFPDLIAWRDRLESLGSVGGVMSGRAALAGQGDPEFVRVSRVTEEFLPALRAVPHVGRLFTSDDFRGGHSVVLLDYGFWQRRWGDDHSVIGRQIRLDQESVTIAGILDPDFSPPEALTGRSVDMWAPLDPDRPELQHRDWYFLEVVARLTQGVALPTAQAELDALMGGFAQEYPEFYIREDGSPREFRLVPLREATVRDVKGTLTILLGAVGFLLLIACANVANLFLSRSTARAGEIALRGALGASRGRITRQLLTESAALALAGGALGIGLAYFGVDAFTRYNPGGIPRVEAVAVDMRVLLVALLASVGTGIACGVLPVLQAILREPKDGLGEGVTSAVGRRERGRVRNGLVIAEIALTLLLLAGSGLLLRSMVERLQVDPGFEVSELITLSVDLEARYSGLTDLVTPSVDMVPSYSEVERAQFVRDLRERIEAIPGTQAMAAAWDLPFVYTGGVRCCWTTEVWPGDAPQEAEVPRILIHPVTPRYFEVLDAPVAHGREFTWADADADARVAVLNKPAALSLFDVEDAVGRAIRFAGRGIFTVVGVVEGVHHWGLDQGVEEAVYVLHEELGTFDSRLHVAVRSSAGLDPLAPALREAVWALDPDLPVGEVVTMRQRVSRSLATPRFLSILFASFAGVALLLACGGIYASVLYSVGQRRREMGIRMALGADGTQVLRLVMRHGSVLTCAGLGLGLAGALAASRVLESLLWGVSSTDLPTLSGVTLLLALAALGACWAPARKASKTSPLESLRV